MTNSDYDGNVFTRVKKINAEYSVSPAPQTSPFLQGKKCPDGARPADYLVGHAQGRESSCGEYEFHLQCLTVKVSYVGG